MSRAAGSTTTDWIDRYAQLSARGDDLAAAEWDELGLAAWFIGRQEESEDAWTRAHLAYLADDDVDAAVRCVFWTGFTLGESGETVKASAWMARLFELCDQPTAGARSQATRALCQAVAARAAGGDSDVIGLSRRAETLATAAGETDVAVLATMNLGRALLLAGHAEEGFACMDRVMLRIAAGEVGDRAAGPAYCAVIASLLSRWDLDRARIWTRDLGAWCDTQRGLEPFRGECSVHRATVLELAGEWAAASELLDDVRGREHRPETLENAWYGIAELCRLTGRRAEAESAYRRAAQLGRSVQPGLALLHRDAGQTAAARAGLSGALGSERDPGRRADLLAAAVDLAVDAGETPAAATASAELRTIADAFGTEYLSAAADRAEGTVAISAGAASDAVPALRRSWAGWRRLDAPYESARTRALLGRAIRDLGDEEGAQLEFDAAREAFTALGAVPDLTRLERESNPELPTPPGGLTRRELEVLRLLARGSSNRRLAEDLFLSERTVARHVANILTKLGVPNRSAATAFAFENGLMDAD